VAWASGETTRESGNLNVSDDRRGGCGGGLVQTRTHHRFTVSCAASYSAHATSRAPAALLTSRQASLSLRWADSIAAREGVGGSFCRSPCLIFSCEVHFAVHPRVEFVSRFLTNSPCWGNNNSRLWDFLRHAFFPASLKSRDPSLHRPLKPPRRTARKG
jgi:hypothetical protein